MYPSGDDKFFVCQLMGCITRKKSSRIHLLFDECPINFLPFFGKEEEGIFEGKLHSNVPFVTIFCCCWHCQLWWWWQ